MLKQILEILILLTAIPAAYILAYLCKDEMKAGQKWFMLILTCSLLAIFILLFINFNPPAKMSIILSLFYIAIVSAISFFRVRSIKEDK